MIGKTNAFTGGGGVQPTGTLSITENGIYDIASYASANVNVPQVFSGYTFEDYLAGSVSSFTTSLSVLSGNSVFYDYSGLQYFSASKLTSLHYNEFYHCVNLHEVYMPLITSLPAGTFSWCTSLTSIITDSITHIGSYCFYSCTKLSSAFFKNIINTVIDISIAAFQGCNFPSIANFNNCVHMADTALIYINNLSSGTINFPKLSMTGDGFTIRYTDTILNCPKLYGPRILWNAGSFSYVYAGSCIGALESTRALLYSAFNIATISLGNGAHMESTCFASACSNITNVYINATQVPRLASSNDAILKSSVFYNLYVPSQCLTAYKNATNWTLRASDIKGYVTDNPIETISDSVSNSTSLTLNIDCEIGDHLVLCAAVRYNYTIPSGWTLLYESSVYYVSGSMQQRAIILTKTATSTLESATIVCDTSGRIYMTLCNLKNKNVNVRTSMCYTTDTLNELRTTTIVKDTDNPVLFYISRGLANNSPSNFFAKISNAYNYLGIDETDSSYNWNCALGDNYRVTLIYTDDAQGNIVLTTKENTYYDDYSTATYHAWPTQYSIVALEIIP